MVHIITAQWSESLQHSVSGHHLERTYASPQLGWFHGGLRETMPNYVQHEWGILPYLSIEVGT
jgi:hypothetical protein